MSVTLCPQCGRPAQWDGPLAVCDVCQTVIEQRPIARIPLCILMWIVIVAGLLAFGLSNRPRAHAMLCLMGMQQ